MLTRLSRNRSDIHQGDTKQKNDLRLPKCRISTVQRDINSLPKEIRKTKSPNLFGKKIFNKYFNS